MTDKGGTEKEQCRKSFSSLRSALAHIKSFRIVANYIVSWRRAKRLYLSDEQTGSTLYQGTIKT